LKAAKLNLIKKYTLKKGNKDGKERAKKSLATIAARL